MGYTGRRPRKSLNQGLSLMNNDKIENQLTGQNIALEQGTTTL